VRWRDSFTPAVAALTVAVGFLALFPTVMLFYGSFTDGDLGGQGKLTLGNYAAAYAVFGVPSMAIGARLLLARPR